MPPPPTNPLPIRRRAVSVIGPSEPDPELYRLAEQIGREVGRRDLVLVCGGHGGVMEAACRGALDAGGLTVGLLRTESAADANSFVQVAIPTGLGEARNIAVVLSGDVVVAIGLSAGTLSEIAFASKHGKTMIAVRPPAPVPGVEWIQVEEAEEAARELDRLLPRP